MFDDSENKILIDEAKNSRINLDSSQNSSYDEKFRSHNNNLYESWKYHENSQANQIEFDEHEQNKSQIDSSVDVLIAISIESQTSIWKIQHHIKRF